MGFCPVFLGILPYSWQNASRDTTCEQVTPIHMFPRHQSLFFSIYKIWTCLCSCIQVDQVILSAVRIYYISYPSCQSTLTRPFCHIFSALVALILWILCELKTLSSHDWSHVLPDALGVRLNIGRYACNLGAQLRAFSMPDTAGSHITGSPLYICLHLCCS